MTAFLKRNHERRIELQHQLREKNNAKMELAITARSLGAVVLVVQMLP